MKIATALYGFSCIAAIQVDCHAYSSEISLLEGKETLSVLTWNGKRLGRDKFRADLAAKIFADKSPDVVVLQEVLLSAKGIRGVKSIQSLLQKNTGRTYCFGVSDPSEGQAERKAILWATDELTYITTKGTDFAGNCTVPGITLPLMLSRASELDREPAYAVLRHTVMGKFLIAGVHLVPTAKHPAQEIEPLFASPLGTPYKNLPTIIAGDFNLASGNPAYVAATANGFSPTLPRGIKTSLKMKSREMSQEYDNIWVKGFECTKGNVLNSYKILESEPTKTIFYDVSDHAPVETVCRLQTTP